MESNFLGYFTGGFVDFSKISGCYNEILIVNIFKTIHFILLFFLSVSQIEFEKNIKIYAHKKSNGIFSHKCGIL